MTLGAICIVLLLYVFTGELDSRTVARFSVDHKLWEQPKPKGPKMTEEQEEAAGLGHHVRPLPPGLTALPRRCPSARARCP